MIDEAITFETTSSEEMYPFQTECKKHENVDWKQEIDDCKIISSTETSKIVKHTCGCYSENKWTIAPARKLGARISQELMARVVKLKERLNR